MKALEYELANASEDRTKTVRYITPELQDAWHQASNVDWIVLQAIKIEIRLEKDIQ